MVAHSSANKGQNLFRWATVHACDIPACTQHMRTRETNAYDLYTRPPTAATRGPTLASLTNKENAISFGNGTIPSHAGSYSILISMSRTSTSTMSEMNSLMRYEWKRRSTLCLLIFFVCMCLRVIPLENKKIVSIIGTVMSTAH